MAHRGRGGKVFEPRVDASYIRRDFDLCRSQSSLEYSCSRLTFCQVIELTEEPVNNYNKIFSSLGKNNEPNDAVFVLYPELCKDIAEKFARVLKMVVLVRKRVEKGFETTD